MPSAEERSKVFTDQVAQFNATNQWGIVVTQAGYGDYPTLFDAVNSAIASGGTPDLVAALPEADPGLERLRFGGGSDTLISATQPGGWEVEAQPIFQQSSGLRIPWQENSWECRPSVQPASCSTTRPGRMNWASITHPQLRMSSASRLAQPTHPSAGTPTRRMMAMAAGSWTTDWQTIYSWMLAFGGGVVDGNGSYGFRTDPNLAALQFLKGLYDDKCAWLASDPNNPKDISHGPYFDQFAKRLALFVSGDLAEVPRRPNAMSQQKNTDEWTLLPFPVPPAASWLPTDHLIAC